MILVGLVLYLAVGLLFVVSLAVAAGRPTPTPERDDSKARVSPPGRGSCSGQVEFCSPAKENAAKYGRLLLGGLSLFALWARAGEQSEPSSFLALEISQPAGLLTDEGVPLEPRNSVWQHSVGDGLRKGVWNAGFALGGGLGTKILGSRESHDFALGTAHVGRVITGILASDHWYRGNVELVGEFFGGRQLNPNDAYVAGFTPVLRYDLATDTRWMPFLEGGAGVSWTDVGHPDLATRFEFHLVVGGGVRWFWRDNVAITAQYRFAHLSNAGIEKPNNGVNTNVLLLGVTWFF